MIRLHSLIHRAKWEWVLANRSSTEQVCKRQALADIARSLNWVTWKLVTTLLHYPQTQRPQWVRLQSASVPRKAISVGNGCSVAFRKRSHGLSSVHSGQVATSQKPPSAAWAGSPSCPLLPGSPFLLSTSGLYAARAETDIFHHQLAASLKRGSLLGGRKKKVWSLMISLGD